MMGQSLTEFIRCLFLCGWMTLLIYPMGCGAVGPPIPPEDVGIEAKIRKQRQEQMKQDNPTFEDELISPAEEAIELPPIYPIGTR